MKSILSKALLSSVILILATACAGSNSSQSETLDVEEGIDIQKNPLEAIQKALEIGKNTSDIIENPRYFN